MSDGRTARVDGRLEDVRTSMCATLKNLTPMLGVADVKATRDFYCEKLGFDCLNSLEFEGKMGWCVLGAGATLSDQRRGRVIEIMFTTGEEACGGGSMRLSHHDTILYFYPDDVEALRAQFVARGVAASELRVTFYGMKEFTVEDPDGYQLWFGQDTDEKPTEQ